MNRWREKFAAGFGFFALLGAAGFAIFSCGLEEYVYLYPPSAMKTGPILTLTNDAQNDPSVFVGYRFFYKFLSSISSVDSEVSNVESLFERFPTSIDSRMRSAGFNYVKLQATSEVIDFIIDDVADRQIAFSITLDFNDAVSKLDSSQAVLTIEAGIATSPSVPIGGLRLLRSVVESSGIGFSYDERDVTLAYTDLGSNYDALGTTYLLVYVLAIGYNASFGEVYSEPKYFVGTEKHINMPVKNW